MSLLYCIVNQAMNYNTDIEVSSSGSDVSSENTKAIKEISEAKRNCTLFTRFS
jgi:hypothetical protein